MYQELTLAGGSLPRRRDQLQLPNYRVQGTETADNILQHEEAARFSHCGKEDQQSSQDLNCAVHPTCLTDSNVYGHIVKV